MKDLLLKIPSALRPFAEALIEKIEKLEDEIKDLKNPKSKGKDTSKKK